jgi:hypothetical protein
MNIKSILWENLKNYPEIIEKRARMSGSLLLSPFAQEALIKFKR